jgi:hypothetical protein
MGLSSWLDEYRIDVRFQFNKENKFLALVQDVLVKPQTKNYKQFTFGTFCLFSDRPLYWIWKFKGPV